MLQASGRSVLDFESIHSLSQHFRCRSFSEENFMRLVSLVVIMLSMFFFQSENLHAEEPAFPSSMLGFIKPGMQLGLSSSKTDSPVSIWIYSDEKFRIATDAREMTMEEMEKKYPQIEEQKAKTLAELVKSRPDMASSGHEPTVTLAVDRAILLCTVLFVGEDYFLVTYDPDNMKKLAIAKHKVDRIHFADDNLVFWHSWGAERRQ
jgi:hypothetical protein